MSNRRGFMQQVIGGGTVMAVSGLVPSGLQTHQGKKVFMITDMEGVDGVFNFDDQCEPFKSARWKESQELLTGEVNAAVDGLYAAGATEVVVADLHDSSRSLSVLTIDPRARLLQGTGIPPTLGIDSSYSAVVFIGQHPMAGAKDGVISHTYAFSIQNAWVNNTLVGELGTRTMLAGYFGVPVIMASGDTALCKEFHALVPNGQCAAVKTGFSRTGGISLSHKEACDLIREKAQAAMEHLSEYKPYKVSNPVEFKVEFTVESMPVYWPEPDVERLNPRTYVYRGKDFLEAYLKQPLK